MMGFDGTTSYDPDGIIESYLWNFGDGTIATDPAINHVYSIAGEYSVPLSVIDDGGATAQDIVTITVVENLENALPTADFTATAFVEDLSTFQFSGVTSVDSDGEIVNYSWNFGDGETGAGDVIFHQYLNPGIYYVTLTVMDNHGGTSKKVAEVNVVTAESEMLHIEVGKMSISGALHQVVFAEPFENPVVIANPASYADSDPGIVRINNVQESGFDIRFQNWEYLGTEHSSETVSYIVMEAGSYVLTNGSRLEVGRFDTDLTGDFIQVSFIQPFEIDPVVITSIVSAVGSDTVAGRIMNVTTSGFKYTMQEQESNIPEHVMENVNYLAWEPSQGNISDVLAFEVGKTENVITHDWNELVFSQQFASPPMFFADMQSFNGSDTSSLRYQSLLTESVQVKITEEESLDVETAHVPEEVGIILLENLGQDVCTSDNYVVVNAHFSALPSPDTDRVIFFDASESSCYEMVNCTMEDRECVLEWDFGGSGSIVGGDGNNIVVFQYNEGGEYTVTLTMTELNSNMTSTDNIAITALAVEASSSSNYFSTEVTGNTVTLTVSVPENVVNMQIFWGDRKRSKYDSPIPKTVEHTYKRLGEYSLHISTVDEAGSKINYTFVDDEDLAISVP